MAFLVAVFLILASLVSAGTVSDSSMGYVLTLPSGWSQVKAKPEQHYFRDSTRKYRSQISIVRYAIDKETYPTPESWTQAQFIAYKLSVETSSYPFGAVGFYDSTSAARLGPVWSPEAFSVLYPADGDPTYCEFVRYCAVGNSGYEIYAIGDSTDMTANVDFYSQVIATVTFTPVLTNLRDRKRAAVFGREFRVGVEEFDLAGRLVTISRRSGASSRKPWAPTWRKPSF